MGKTTTKLVVGKITVNKILKWKAEGRIVTGEGPELKSTKKFS